MVTNWKQLTGWLGLALLGLVPAVGLAQSLGLRTGLRLPATTASRIVDPNCVEIYSVKTGDWNDPTVWSCGRLPTANDVVVLRHHVEVPPSVAANAYQLRFEQTLRQRYPNGIANLTKGVNLSSWFGSSVPVGNFTNRFGPTAFAQIKNMGFRHVRIPIGPNHLFQEATPGTLNPVALSALTTGVDGLLAAGLAVIIDPIHPNGDSDFEQKLANDPAFLPKAQAYWQAIATHFASRPTDKVFFEVMNEPHMAGPPNWYQMAQTALISTIRTATPQHVIIATAADWGSMDALLAVTPTDKNVVWNFHYYSAMVFTHQAATWITPEFAIMGDVPYPSTPQNVAPAVAYINSQTAASAATRQTATEWVNYYGSEGWNTPKIATDLGRIVAWANQHGVLVSCNEFGTYKLRAPTDSRVRWVTDVRTYLDQQTIGWSMWEYDEGFGLVTYTDPVNRTGPTADPALVTALGL